MSFNFNLNLLICRFLFDKICSKNNRNEYIFVTFDWMIMRKMFGTKNWYILVECLLLEWESHPDSTSHKMGPFIRLRPRLRLDWELKKNLNSRLSFIKWSYSITNTQKTFIFFRILRKKKKKKNHLTIILNQVDSMSVQLHQ